ncbi:hypothetical protein RQP46_010584 [Phenoliferia psychrophenolica]
MSSHGHLFVLEARRGLVRTCRVDGSGMRTLVSGYEGVTPDGLQVDIKNGHVYWTCMGKVWSENDGFIERCDLKDGGNITHIVKPGNTFTPKQLQLDHVNSKLYWCDREGLRVMRCNLDGTSVETLVQTGSTAADRLDERLHCVGIALDIKRGLVYWTQKGPPKGGQGTLFRTALKLPAGETPATRTDIEVLFSNLPEPIDLEIDEEKQILYWSDRGGGPAGNSFNSAPVGATSFSGKYDVLQTGFKEAIGIAVDLKRGKAFIADLGGVIHAMRLDGTHESTIYEAGSEITGIVFADIE